MGLLVKVLIGILILAVIWLIASALLPQTIALIVTLVALVALLVSHDSLPEFNGR